MVTQKLYVAWEGLSIGTQPYAGTVVYGYEEYWVLRECRLTCGAVTLMLKRRRAAIERNGVRHYSAGSPLAAGSTERPHWCR